MTSGVELRNENRVYFVLYLFCGRWAAVGQLLNTCADQCQAAVTQHVSWSFATPGVLCLAVVFVQQHADESYHGLWQVVVLGMVD